MVTVIPYGGKQTKSLNDFLPLSIAKLSLRVYDNGMIKDTVTISGCATRFILVLKMLVAFASHDVDPNLTEELHRYTFQEDVLMDFGKICNDSIQASIKMCACSPKEVIMVLRYLGDDGTYDWIDAQCVYDLFVYLKSTRTSDDCSDLSPQFFKFIVLKSDCKIDHPMVFERGETALEWFLRQPCFEMDASSDICFFDFRDMYFEFRKTRGLQPIKWEKSHFCVAFSLYGIHVEQGKVMGVRFVGREPTADDTVYEDIQNIKLVKRKECSFDSWHPSHRRQRP